MTNGNHRNLLAMITAALVLLPWSHGAEEAPRLDVAEVPEWGTALVDARGHSLYVYTRDEEAGDGFACVDACVNNWIPLEAESADALTLGEGVDADLVEVRERPDGTSQVTYGGRPLYTSRRDVEPGQTRGQGLGGEFFLMSPAGTMVTEEVEGEAREVDEETVAALMEEGATLFARHCSTCHGAEGQGRVGPPLAGMGRLENPRFIVNTIIAGRPQHGMPAFGPVLDDHEIAAVATYVRNAWTNEFGPVLEEDVEGMR